jgi:hypothetical protein
MSSFPFSRGPKFFKSRDAGRKFQSSESLSHLIAGVFILQEPNAITENFSQKTTKHKHNKKWRFSSKFQPELIFFPGFVKNR